MTHVGPRNVGGVGDPRAEQLGIARGNRLVGKAGADERWGNDRVQALAQVYRCDRLAECRVAPRIGVRNARSHAGDSGVPGCEECCWKPAFDSRLDERRHACGAHAIRALSPDGSALCFERRCAVGEDQAVDPTRKRTREGLDDHASNRKADEVCALDPGRVEGGAQVGSEIVERQWVGIGERASVSAQVVGEHLKARA